MSVWQTVCDQQAERAGESFRKRLLREVTQLAGGTLTDEQGNAWAVAHETSVEEPGGTPWHTLSVAKDDRSARIISDSIHGVIEWVRQFATSPTCRAVEVEKLRRRIEESLQK